MELREKLLLSLVSFFVVGLGQILKGEGEKGLKFILLFYFAIPGILYFSLAISGGIFLVLFGFGIIFTVLFWLYNIFDAGFGGNP
jgi:hypothetical protein